MNRLPRKPDRQTLLFRFVDPEPPKRSAPRPNRLRHLQTLATFVELTDAEQRELYELEAAR